MSVEILLAYGLGSILILALGYVIGLEKKEDGSQKHPWLRLICIGFFVLSLLFIPFLIDYQGGDCKLYLTSENATNETHTVYGYEEICLESLFTDIYFWFMFTFVITFIFFIVFTVFIIIMDWFAARK